MLTIPSSEFSKNFGKYRETVQRETVAVTSHERVTGFFISPETYQEYENLKARSGKALALTELSEETIQAIANARMDPRHDHLNALLDE